MDSSLVAHGQWLSQRRQWLIQAAGAFASKPLERERVVPITSCWTAGVPTFSVHEEDEDVTRPACGWCARVHEGAWERSELSTVGMEYAVQTFEVGAPAVVFRAVVEAHRERDPAKRSGRHASAIHRGAGGGLQGAASPRCAHGGTPLA